MHADLAIHLRTAVRAASGRAEVHAAIEEIYREVAEAIAGRRPSCEMSGRCCRFDAYGHRLYVSTLELAVFLDHCRSGGVATDLPDGAGCRFQTGKLCGVHKIRPFGCRMFFCDPSAQEWVHQRYELYHARLKQLHQELGVPYFYVEWRAALEAVLAAENSAAVRTDVEL